MILCDVNVLVYAFRADMAQHQAYADWLNAQASSGEAFGVSGVVLSGFLRLVTNPRVFKQPSDLDPALEFLDALQRFPTAVAVREGGRHWEIFERLCRTAGVRANLVPDAYLAALAIESGAEWITADRGFARYPGLRWRHPLDTPGSS